MGPRSTHPTQKVKNTIPCMIKKLEKINITYYSMILAYCI